ncbi:MAG TPA: septal ring lytic transglycosylase RlpA family protein [Candidatus Limnocylindrales bacterium]|nr:septal ring lytic transglycosylase RlpA family protein [Candidatus Limnocylindrales bacterium]
MKVLTLLPLLSLAVGCAASTYPLRPANTLLTTARATHSKISPTTGASTKGTAVLRQQGHCSWYGSEFHGRRTSNGERFDKHELTAAHRTLPFGTLVEVTDLETGRDVRVRINDRGPYARGRVIDISHAAAAELGILHKGVAKVEVRVVEPHKSDWSGQGYALQVASFDSRAEAEGFVAGLTDKQKAAAVHYIKPPDPTAKAYRVRFGPLACEQTAKKVAEKLRLAGLESSVIQEQFVSQRVVADAKH